LLVSLEIPSKDQSFPWLLKWMEQQSLKTKAKTHELSIETHFIKRENGSTETQFSLLPGPGHHYFKYQGSWFLVERQRASKLIDIKSGSPWETITFKTLSRDRHLFFNMLEEAKTLALQNEEGKTVIYTSMGPQWKPSGLPRRKRPLDSVVLDTGLSDLIVNDVHSFLRGGRWYHERGIPYRRGYLLYGPPGSGKTSFILALAGELDYNICVMNLSERGMTDDRLSYLLSNAPPRSLILLEDVDAAFVHRSINATESHKSVFFCFF
jgi:chaperone BCS1